MNFTPSLFRRPWLAVAVVVLAIGAALPSLRSWATVELRLFDQLTLLSAPRKTTLPIVIVGIDEASFAAIGKRWPWPRDLHARLIDRLYEDGAAVIGFDVMFSEAASNKEDSRLAATIRRAGNVVLAADHAYRESESLRQWMRVDPLPMFLEAGALSGLTSATLDADALLRRVPDAHDIFWRQVIAMLKRQRPDLDLAGGIAEGAMIRHLGPAHTFPYVPFHRVLDGGLPPGFFRDQVVLVGRDVRASPEVGSAQSDLFATPFLGGSGELTPGVEVQATLLENALLNIAIVPVGSAWTTLALLCFGLLGAAALRFWHPLGSAAWMLVLGAAAFGLSYWLFSARSQWLPVLAVLLTLLAMYLGMGLVSYLVERRRAARIQATFSKYVSPMVVQQLVAHPELVRLGGERRELSLLFCDLAGFTTMSERLTPENVARVINLYLSEMTRVIMATGGTVDKFIGDAVMAFWGAPLDDPDHARHAVQAAIEMQQAMANLAPQLAELGAGKVALRIGIHSGPAVVGNMGSDERFDYTALGDTVNLASRLEGVNKAYGTGILLSATTANALGGGVPLREIDRVRVKGKDQPVDIYTPCADAALVARSDVALAAYRAGDWAEARRLWSALAVEFGEDGPAAAFLQRIEASDPPPPDWDGAVALEKG